MQNELGTTLIQIANQAEVKGDDDAYDAAIEEAKTHFLAALEIDSENVTAHANLAKIYDLLDQDVLEKHHRKMHARFKPDDNASEVATKARAKYPAASRAAEALVIYDLQRKEAFLSPVAEIPNEAVQEQPPRAAAVPTTKADTK